MPFALDARATALPRSLALSSLSYLTAVVVLLLARTLVHAPETHVVEIPSFHPPIIDVGNYAPPPPPGVAPPVAQPSVIPSAPVVLPVDDPAQEAPPQAFSPTAPSSTTGPGAGPATGPGNSGPGTGPPSEQPAPPPGTWENIETLPVLVHKVEPVYPEILRQAGMDGQVTLWLRVGADGHVHEVRVVGESSLFDDEARNAARQFVFTPATSDGHPVPVWVRMAIRFVLRD